MISVKCYDFLTTDEIKSAIRFCIVLHDRVEAAAVEFKCQRDEAE